MEEDSNLRLRPFVEDVCYLHYEPRRFFFEFFNEEEDISKDKEIILMDKVRECVIYYCSHTVTAYLTIYLIGHK